ncbi:MAG: hypothetical protein FWD65_03355 [Coriobacteriia bacterium]|nr:hypothetical protein [Coriobacteriia bacterium]
MSVQDRKDKLKRWRHTYPEMLPYVTREELRIARLERTADAKAQLKPRYYQAVLQNGDSLNMKRPR